MEEFTSPLKKWPGSFSLPDYDDFTGEMFDTWQRCWKDTPDTQLNRVFCYAGLRLINELGEWHMETPLGEILAWEKDKKAERMRLVSWIGKSVRSYTDELINPKG